MEGHTNKGRRIYSLEPRKIMQADFARKYVNYLVPALTKIRKEISSSDQSVDHATEETVRFEVDVALALSAEGFAWSHALKDKLQLNVNNVGRFRTSLTLDQLLASFKISSSTYGPNHANIIDNEADDNQNAMLLIKISSNLNQEPIAKISKRAKRTKMKPGTMTEQGMESEEEEDEIRRRLTEYFTRRERDDD